VAIDNGFSLRRQSTGALTATPSSTGLMSEAKAYNGKVLPGRAASIRKVRISATPQGGRQLVMEPGPQVKPQETHHFTKRNRALQQVIFPSRAMKRVPSLDQHAP
jgi:hypothetical protein